MGLNTDFNVSPYFDDFDESKNFHKILFKPSFPIQARELTQLQTILQNQVERFGENILREGTIVKGGNFIEESPLPYVKLLDNNVDGNAVTPSAYEGHTVVGSVSGLRARVVASETGLESQSPNLNTIYVKYLNTNNSEEKYFRSTENLEVRDADDNLIDTVVVGGISDSAPTGYGYGVRCGEGIIFQKGHFVRFTDDIVIVSKYNQYPDNVAIGFVTEESIVDSDEDTSLLDNSNGFNNYNAPGADRLRLTPVLTAKTIDEAKADDAFFALQEYQLGKVVRRRLTTQYNQIEKYMEKRTMEESGNYAVSPFPITIEQSNANTQFLSIVIGPGLAYIEGHRVELLGDIVIDVPEATESANISNQDIITTYGNYLVSDNYRGHFPFTTMDTVDILDGSNTVIGTCRVRNVARDGDTLYRFYIFDTQIGSSYNGRDARALSYNSGQGYAELVLEDSGDRPKFLERQYRFPIYPTGRSFIKAFDLSATDYYYRGANTALEATTGGVITITIPGTDSWPYTVGSNLTLDQKRELLLICNETANNYTLGDPIDLTNATVYVDSATQLTVTLDAAPDVAMDVIGYYTAKRNVSAPNTLALDTVYVKIDSNTHPVGTGGAYSLGMPHVYSLENVWKVAAGEPYSESGTDVTDEFRLYSDQRDTHYGLSYIRAKRTLTIDAGDKFLIKCKVFRKTNATNSFFIVNSYPVDDTSLVLPSDKIRTEDIPTFTASNGTEVYLRDVVDFRPFPANTAVYSTTAVGATENPLTLKAATNGFGTSDMFFPAHGKSLETTYSYYLGRIDRLYVDEYGDFQTIQGIASENPVTPGAPEKGMTIAVIEIPPFPSLPADLASVANKPEYGIKLFPYSIRRYTMEDIGDLDKRLSNIEYYTALTLLEKSAKDLTIQDANGLDRFKNGILVDNFEDLSIANVDSDEFSAAHDSAYKEILPRQRAYPLDLIISGGAGVTDYGEMVTMNSFDVVAIDQPYATSLRSCSTNYYRYNGIMELFPEHDAAPDVTRAPIVNVHNPKRPFVRYVSRLNEFVKLQRVKNYIADNNITVKDIASKIQTVIGTTETTSNLIKRVAKTFQINSGFAGKKVGDYIADINFNPYIRSKEVEVYVTGLRPNTRFYFFFDGKDVNEHMSPALDKVGNWDITPGDPDEYTGTAVDGTDDKDPINFDRTLFPSWTTAISSVAVTSVSVSSFIKSRKFKRFRRASRYKRLQFLKEIAGRYQNYIAIVINGRIYIIDKTNPIAPFPDGDVDLSTLTDYPLDYNIIRSDENGVIRAVFRIPERTFLVGERQLECFDVPYYDDKDAATSYASTTYRAFNFGITKGTVTTTTRVPHFDFATAIDPRSESGVTNSATTRTVAPPGLNGTAPNSDAAAGRPHRKPPMGVKFRDPIAQTFIVDPDQSSDNSILISKIDLYIAKKSATNGLVVEIREVENGVPSSNVLPFSRVLLSPGQINASFTSADTPTTVAFNSPIPIKTNQEYAIVLLPNANDPDYYVWVSKVGDTDIDTGEAITQDTNAGMIFTSTNNRSWTSYQDENLKFTLYKKQFRNERGWVTLTNPYNEFLEISNTTSLDFTVGENVFVSSNTYLTGNVSITAGNTTIVGDGTLFTSEYSVGEHIVVEIEAGDYQALEILSIQNNTSMSVTDIPFDTVASIPHYRSVVGIVEQYNTTSPATLVLSGSTAKTGFIFSAGDVIVGEESGATATIDEVKDQPITYLQANIFRNDFSRTRSSLIATKLWNGTTTYKKVLKFEDDNYMTDTPTYIRSRSNEVLYDSGEKSFELGVYLQSISDYTRDTAPMIDHALSNVTIYENIVNNDSSFEIGQDGVAESKYISKKVELAAGFDAEDIKVWLTAYRPPKTDVEVYVKFQNGTDGGSFDDADEVVWTKLERKTESDAYSSTADRFDYREYEFGLGTTDLTAGNGAWLDSVDGFTYIAPDGSVYYDYKYFAVKIVMLSEDHSAIPRVKDMRAIALT